VTRHPRERVTIDLRGIGPRLTAHAAARGMTTSAAVRSAVIAMLDAEDRSEESDDIAAANDLRVVKVTVRMGAVHAALLARRARSADVSQGAYVVGLLEATPPTPRSLDHAEAVAALVDSTRQVAAMSADLHAFMRFIRGAQSSQAERYRAGRHLRCGRVAADSADLASADASAPPRSMPCVQPGTFTW
jgi:hypothetical protein